MIATVSKHGGGTTTVAGAPVPGFAVVIHQPRARATGHSATATNPDTYCCFDKKWKLIKCIVGVIAAVAISAIVLPNLLAE